MWGLRRGRLFARRTLQPALFLDRDGVIVEEVDHLHRPEDVRLLDGAAALIRRANELRIPTIVITNQAGVGRGMYDWAAFLRVTATIDEALARQGARIDAVYACPFHHEGVAPYRHPNHPARKPNAGMFHRAAEECRIDLGGSWFVGDHSDDILAAREGASMARSTCSRATALTTASASCRCPPARCASPSRPTSKRRSRSSPCSRGPSRRPADEPAAAAGGVPSLKAPGG